MIVVFLLARLAIGAGDNAIIGGIADGDVAECRTIWSTPRWRISAASRSSS